MYPSIDVAETLPALLEEDGVDIVAGHVGGWTSGFAAGQNFVEKFTWVLWGLCGLGLTPLLYEYVAMSDERGAQPHKRRWSASTQWWCHEAEGCRSLKDLPRSSAREWRHRPRLARPKVYCRQLQANMICTTTNAGRTSDDDAQTRYSIVLRIFMLRRSRARRVQRRHLQWRQLRGCGRAPVCDVLGRLGACRSP